jgi:hypothetical protein
MPKDGRDDLRYDLDRSNVGDTLLRKELIFEVGAQLPSPHSHSLVLFPLMR